MKTMLRAITFGVAVILSGCSTIGPLLYDAPKADKLPDGRYNVGTLLGHAKPNDWWRVDADEFARTLARAGCNATQIELCSWRWDQPGAKMWTDPAAAVEAGAEFVKAMRKYGIVTCLTLWNENKGGGKYPQNVGPKNTALPADFMRKLILLVASKIGTEAVILCPVSEWGNSTSARWYAECRAVWTGLMSDNQGSRPKGPGHGCQHFEYHPFVAGDAGPAGAIVLADTYPLILALEDKARLAEWAKHLHQAGRAAIHYDFLDTSDTIDKASMEAVGKARK